jgi:hypothetical protein
MGPTAFDEQLATNREALENATSENLPSLGRRLELALRATAALTVAHGADRS